MGTLDETVMNGHGNMAGTVKKAFGFESTSTPLKSDNAIPSTATNFDRIVETKTSYDGINVSLYKSRETGLKILIADVEIPLVHPFLECFDGRFMDFLLWRQRFGMIAGVLT